MLLHNKPTQLGWIAGKYIVSGNCTDVIGGTLTAGSTTAAQASALLTWEPAFVSAPTILATINSGGATTTSPSARFTGVTVSNAYIAIAGGASPISDVTVGIMILGEVKL